MNKCIPATLPNSDTVNNMEVWSGHLYLLKLMKKSGAELVFQFDIDCNKVEATYSLPEFLADLHRQRCTVKLYSLMNG